jgi:hypothetical protein
MIKRHPNHITDTLAIRTILNSAPHDWLIRGLEERDYGIDLSIEFFDGEQPTGQIAKVQVKGTNDKFSSKEPVQFSNFPVKTLEYAELFQEPFYIFYTSITSKKTYFVHAQTYMKTNLKKTTPDWRDQDTVTIYFPESNKLDALGFQKIKEHLENYVIKSEALRFIADFEWFKICWSALLEGEYEYIKQCKSTLRKLLSHRKFVNKQLEFEEKELLDSFDVVYMEIIDNDYINKVAKEEYIRGVDNQLLSIQSSIVAYLRSDDGCFEFDALVDEFDVEPVY